MAKSKNNNVAAKRITDISRSNDVPSSANSKSVIISNRPIVRDPMMTAPEIEDAAPVKTVAGVSHERLIMPPTSSAPLASSDAATKSVQSVPTTPVPEPESVKPPEPSEQKEEDQPLNLEAEEAKLEDAEAERRAELQKLVDDQTYFLPVDSRELKRAHEVIVISVVIALLLALVWFDVALDAGLVHIAGVKAPTHFFSN